MPEQLVINSNQDAGDRLAAPQPKTISKNRSQSHLDNLGAIEPSPFPEGVFARTRHRAVASPAEGRSGGPVLLEARGL